MAKAARQLAMSQPAVSEAIANLEQLLRVRLLDRSTHGVQPTLYANAILKRSTTVFDELQQGVRDIEFLADPSTGPTDDRILRIDCRNFASFDHPGAIFGTISPCHHPRRDSG